MAAELASLRAELRERFTRGETTDLYLPGDSRKTKVHTEPRADSSDRGVPSGTGIGVKRDRSFTPPWRASQGLKGNRSTNVTIKTSSWANKNGEIPDLRPSRAARSRVAREDSPEGVPNPAMMRTSTKS